jgi:hypothetical protein
LNQKSTIIVQVTIIMMYINIMPTLWPLCKIAKKSVPTRVRVFFYSQVDGLCYTYIGCVWVSGQYMTYVNYEVKQTQKLYGFGMPRDRQFNLLPVDEAKNLINLYFWEQKPICRDKYGAF